MGGLLSSCTATEEEDSCTDIGLAVPSSGAHARSRSRSRGRPNQRPTNYEQFEDNSDWSDLEEEEEVDDQFESPLATLPENIVGGVNYLELSPSDKHFIRIVKKFKKSTQDNLIIVSIHRIENYILWEKYKLKKEEVYQTFGRCDEMILFHGTKASNIDSICLNNFDPRLHGTNKGHIFGHGVSFSPLASYASHYTDRSQDGGNTMILARVLVARKCVGNKDTQRPPEGFDTTTDQNGRVVVKYDDHSFYPEFLITYAGRLQQGQRSRNQSRQRRGQRQRYGRANADDGDQCTIL